MRNRSRHFARAFAAGCVAGLLWSSSAPAQSPSFSRDCQSWIDRKGYSTEYIEQKTGKRQPGLAGSWRGNVPVKEVQPGDVALQRLHAPGAMHAALVEEVRRDGAGAIAAVRVSEWNWGKVTDARCLITENFGQLSPSRWIALNDIALVWRTSLPL